MKDIEEVESAFAVANAEALANPSGDDVNRM